MSPARRGDEASLGDLVNACLRVRKYVEESSRNDLDNDDRLLSACCYQIAVIGEAVKRVSADIRGRYPEVPWKQIAGMRDRLIHGYDSVDLDQLWITASEDVPALLEQINGILRSDFGK